MDEEDICAMSVLEISSSKMDEAGSVSDCRLGTMSNARTGLTLKNVKNICASCKLEEDKCPGHFSYIRLNYPIVHPLFSKYVLKLLKMFCYNCARFLFVKLDGSFPHFDAVTVEKMICPWCCSPQPVWSFAEETVRIVCSFQFQKSVQMTPQELRIILMNLNKEDLKRISFTTHPENLIITLLPVCPPCVRPPIYIDGQLHDDHLTIQYNEIFKINAKFLDYTTKGVPLPLLEAKKLLYKITNLFLEKRGVRSVASSVTKPVIKRLSGKEGHMRNSIMGKRVDKSGRTVIGPEPTLLINQVAVPKEMADVFTVKETITDYNYAKFEELVRGSKNLHYITRKENGSVRSFNAAYINEDFKLQIGDEINRTLQTGDTVLINRQPTLHSGSLIAFNAVVKPGRTIRFNLSNTKTFNADFDGDEMNIHVPQMCNASCELDELSSIRNHLLSQKNGKPNIVLVQDNILALYLMTEENMDIEREEFFDLMMHLVDEDGCEWSFERISTERKRVERDFRARPYCSRAVISLCFPSNFNYKDEEAQIEKGNFVTGAFSSKVMNKVFDIIYHIYPAKICEMVVNNLQLISNNWLQIRGFSIGLRDCIVKDEGIMDTINFHVEKSFHEANLVEETVTNPRIKEVKIQEALNKAQSVGLRISKEGLYADNNFSLMIQSGSKGNYFNIAQICGLLGQQYIKGKRVDSKLNNGTRTLYHYPFEMNDVSDKYTSRGFVKSNFYGGLNPKDMFFHAEAGRAGVVDTAMGTSDTGYMHRRMAKLMEDLKVTYDGTVRDENNSILQFSYGNGFDVTRSPNPRYIETLADVLNNEYENLNGN